MRATSTTPEHTPAHLHDRHTWLCESCREPWPCGPARAMYLGERLPSGYLSALMYHHLRGYLTAFPNEDPGAAWDRFVGWVRPGRAQLQREEQDDEDRSRQCDVAP